MTASKSGWLKVIIALAVAAVAFSLYCVYSAPMGPSYAGALAQKIFYYHVGSAITMNIAFIVGAIACIAYLHTRKPRWDRVAASNIEVGLVFCTLVLITGPMWARPVWGTWWRWEPRLVTFLIMWFTYVVYFLLRRSIENPRMRARLSAVYGILACLNIPLVALATRLWRPGQQLHPSSVTLSAVMVETLLASVVALALVYVVAATLRYRLATVQAMIREEEGEEQP